MLVCDDGVVVAGGGARSGRSSIDRMGWGVLLS